MLKGIDKIWIAAALVAIGYILFYTYGLYVKDNFKDCRTVLDTTNAPMKPYVTTETSRGDFEQDFVYSNEGGRDTGREAILMAKRKFPFDWSQLPPDSSLFQAQQSLFVKDSTTKAAPFKDYTYTDIESKKVLPPDESKDKEKDALVTYKPMNSKVVDEKDVNRLIKDIYGEKGLVARVAKKANNVYEIYEVREKNPKIVYEDEMQASMQSNELAPKVDPSEMLVVPNAVNDYNPGIANIRSEKTRTSGKNQYNDTSRNLEGIFGPKMQWQQYG
jgi:hypothetical protein